MVTGISLNNHAMRSLARHRIQQDAGSQCYSDPQILSRACPAAILPQEPDRLRATMQELISQPEIFHHWSGEFASQPRHEPDIAPPQPPYQVSGLRDALQQGERLTRLHGLRVLKIAGDVFVNGEKIHSEQQQGLTALASHLNIDQHHPCETLNDEPFLTTFTALVNNGYWYCVPSPCCAEPAASCQLRRQFI